MLSKYKLLLLDADNTLLDFDAAEHHALAAVFAEFNWTYNDEIYNFYHHCNDTLWKALEKGLVTRPQLKILRFEQTGAWMKTRGFSVSDSPDYEDMCKAYIAHLGECGKLLPGADSLCRELQKHYRLSVVTNGTASVQHSRMKLSGLENYFEHLFISEEIGAEKPSPAFFRKVFEAYPEISREEMLLIGDSLSSDMKGAHNAGIDSCFLNHSKPDIPVTYQASTFDELKRILL